MDNQDESYASDIFCKHCGNQVRISETKREQRIGLPSSFIKVKDLWVCDEHGFLESKDLIFNSTLSKEFAKVSKV